MLRERELLNALPTPIALELAALDTLDDPADRVRGVGRVFARLAHLLGSLAIADLLAAAPASAAGEKWAVAAQLRRPKNGTWQYLANRCARLQAEGLYRSAVPGLSALLASPGARDGSRDFSRLVTRREVVLRHHDLRPSRGLSEEALPTLERELKATLRRLVGCGLSLFGRAAPGGSLYEFRSCTPRERQPERWTPPPSAGVWLVDAAAPDAGVALSPLLACWSAEGPPLLACWAHTSGKGAPRYLVFGAEIPPDDVPAAEIHPRPENGALDALQPAARQGADAPSFDCESFESREDVAVGRTLLPSEELRARLFEVLSAFPGATLIEAVAAPEALAVVLASLADRPPFQLVVTDVQGACEDVQRAQAAGRAVLCVIDEVVDDELLGAVVAGLSPTTDTRIVAVSAKDGSGYRLRIMAGGHPKLPLLVRDWEDLLLSLTEEVGCDLAGFASLMPRLDWVRDAWLRQGEADSSRAEGPGAIAAEILAREVAGAPETLRRACAAVAPRLLDGEPRNLSRDILRAAATSGGSVAEAVGVLYEAARRSWIHLDPTGRARVTAPALWRFLASPAAVHHG